jgi:hypothetical protein
MRSVRPCVVGGAPSGSCCRTVAGESFVRREALIRPPAKPCAVRDRHCVGGLTSAKASDCAKQLHSRAAWWWSISCAGRRAAMKSIGVTSVLGAVPEVGVLAVAPHLAPDRRVAGVHWLPSRVTLAVISMSAAVAGRLKRFRSCEMARREHQLAPRVTCGSRSRSARRRQVLLSTCGSVHPCRALGQEVLK